MDADGGVRQLAAAKSTRIIMDGGGETIWQASTAQEIFDLRNPEGSPASGNVFAAVDDLVKAIQNHDEAAAEAAATSLKAAHDHLSQQLGLYGIAQTRVADALNSAAKSIVAGKQALSGLRDADVAGDALVLSQATLQQQAALSARAKTSQLSLFNYLA
jgi:flagellin-like hook-associated protein FlgL